MILLSRFVTLNEASHPALLTASAGSLVNAILFDIRE